MSLNQLNKLNFDNSFIQKLPADIEIQNFCRVVESCCYSSVSPLQPSNPELVAYSIQAAKLINLNQTDCQSTSFLSIFSGQKLLEKMEPYAMCYGGHQFGHWAGQLGDGRAINLGEVINSNDVRWVLQLKGTGPTPYSRYSDGLAVLRSSIREFICSEAMYHLGIPTTRALSLILTGNTVVRDMFYDGNPKSESGAIVCRLSPSFIRFGSFEIFAAQGDIKTLRKLVDYCINTDFPHLGEPNVEVYLKWFDEVCQKTTSLIVHWMRVGFVHGVMNTDNMSILGLTIDYGPYGWLDNYDPNWTPNTTDLQHKRYCFGNQASIALWNLTQLANAIYPLIEQAEPLKQTLSNFNNNYQKQWHQMMAKKLGFSEFIAETDEVIIHELLEILSVIETDWTLFYRQLSKVPCEIITQTDKELFSTMIDAYYHPEEISASYRERMTGWLRTYQRRILLNSVSTDARIKQMNSVNPKFVFRNYLAQLAIDKAEQGDYSMIEELLEVLSDPYAEQPDKKFYAEKRPEWARHRAGCSMLSCSS